MTHEVLTVTEVAELMRVSTDTIYRLAVAGELPGRKVGRAWRFSRSAVTRYLTSGAPATPVSFDDMVLDNQSRERRRNREITEEPATAARALHTRISANSDQRS